MIIITTTHFQVFFRQWSSLLCHSILKREFVLNVCTAVRITFRFCDRAEVLCLLFFEYITWCTHENMSGSLIVLVYSTLFYSVTQNGDFFFLWGDVNANTHGFFAKTHDPQVKYDGDFCFIVLYTYFDDRGTLSPKGHFKSCLNHKNVKKT